MAEVVVRRASRNKHRKQNLKRELTLLPLFGIIYFTVCGGSFGIEPLVGLSGPGLALILLVVTPVIFSIPNMLMVRELNSMMPVEGGYYHWVKQAFGPLVGFLTGWMSWVNTLVDISIYPLLAAYYLGYFFPLLHNGATIYGIEVSAGFLSWLVGLVLIALITSVNMRGAKLAGWTANTLGLIMAVPLIVMSLFGIWNWMQDSPQAPLMMIPQGKNLVGALSTGLFVVIWNYMGWEMPSMVAEEIVKPRKTYPMAMVLVLAATIATYALPTISGIYGGAGDNGKYLMWGAEELEEGEGIALALAEHGVISEQIESWNANPASAVGWEFPQIAHAIGEKTSGQIDSPLAMALGSAVTIAAVISMIGLFIGNSMGGSRLPFAMAEDGMMPRFLTKVHPKYGTPYISILVSGLLFTVFSLETFSSLIVIDVFMNMMVLLIEFMALWKLRFSRPDLKRDLVPGKYFGLVLTTLGPVSMIALAVYSQIAEEGARSLLLALLAVIIGLVIYFPIRRYIKKGVPDINPFRTEEETK